jgi:hypothetical protein
MLTSDGCTFRPAEPQNRAGIVSLLQTVQLLVEDLPKTLDTFLVAEKAGSAR